MPCSTFLNCWALILITIGTGEEVRVKMLVYKSAPLVAGATEDDVRALLGEPDMEWDAWGGWLFFGPRPAQWAYGTTIELEYLILPELRFPNPIPFEIRLFGPDEDDLVIEWNPEKTVSAVKRPEIDVSDELVRLYAPVLHLDAIARELRAKVFDGGRARD